MFVIQFMCITQDPSRAQDAYQLHFDLVWEEKVHTLRIELQSYIKTRIHKATPFDQYFVLVIMYMYDIGYYMET